MMNKKIMVLIVAAFLALTCNAFALPLTYTYDTVIEGSAPLGTSPWLKAVFEQAGADTVKLSLSATGLATSEFVSDWYFNVKDETKLSSLVFSYALSGTVLNQTYRGSDNQTKSPSGFDFDLNFSFKTSNSNIGATSESKRFDFDDFAVITITGLNGLTPEFFDEFTPIKNSEKYKAAAHIQGIGSGLSDVVAPGNPVPEPGTVVLLGVGLLGLAAYGRKKVLR